MLHEGDVTLSLSANPSPCPLGCCSLFASMISSKEFGHCREREGHHQNEFCIVVAASITSIQYTKLLIINSSSMFGDSSSERSQI